MASWKEFLHPRDKNGEFKIAGGHPDSGGHEVAVTPGVGPGVPAVAVPIHRHVAQAQEHAASHQEQAAAFLQRHGKQSSGGHTLNAAAPANRRVDPADVKALETRNMFGG